MRKLERKKLSRRTENFLKARTAKIIEQPSHQQQVDEAQRSWRLKNNKSFEEIKEKLKQMAPGIERCMYCEDSAGTDIEHFRPKSTYPRSAFDWDNYLYACSACNSNYKRSEFPLDSSGQPQLLNPVEEDPRLHIRLSPSTGRYSDISVKGSESIRIFGLNRGLLVRGRRDTWKSVQILISHYGKRRLAENAVEAESIKKIICRFPHSGVLVTLLNVADSPAAASLLMPECIQTISQFPEIRDWRQRL